MAGIRFNDIILTLFHASVRFDRDVFEKLVGRLYDFYDSQERQSGQYKFTSSATGATCVVGANQTRMTEYFQDESREAVIDRVQNAVSAMAGPLGVTRFKAYDVQVSALVLQKDIGNQGKINYLSSEEYITGTFLQELDYAPLGGVSTGVGLRFLYQREKDAYDLRIEPFFKDKKYLFLDLAVQYSRAVEDVSEVRKLLDQDLTYISQNVIDFVRHRNDNG